MRQVPNRGCTLVTDFLRVFLWIVKVNEKREPFKALDACLGLI